MQELGLAWPFLGRGNDREYLSRGSILAKVSDRSLLAIVGSIGRTLTPIEQVLQRPECGLQEPPPSARLSRVPALYGLDQETYAPKEKEKHL